MLMLRVFYKVRHILMEWGPGDRTRASFDLWDTMHFKSYLQYCQSEQGAVERAIHVLELW
jgi:hypothetical protein